MLLKDKVAVIYGAGGAIGGAVAQTFARKGAKLYLSGRRLETVGSVAREISSHGGVADAARVDAFDEAAVEAHIAYMVEKAGRIDVSFNAITAVPQPGTQGISIAELPVDSFLAPINLYMRSQFLTARAAANRMSKAGSGAILMNTPEPARLGVARVGGMGPAWAAMEALSRNLSAGIRAERRPLGRHALYRHAGDTDDRHRLRPARQGAGDHAAAVPGLRRRPDAPQALHVGSRSGRVRSLPRFRQGQRDDRHRRQSHRA
jgi:NAD(P)-dependent dehydrogenase (short-subunit alcohol dehydrogenase family)